LVTSPRIVQDAARDPTALLAACLHLHPHIQIALELRRTFTVFIPAVPTNDVDPTALRQRTDTPIA